MSDQPANILLLEDVTTVQFFVRNALCGLPKPYTLFTAGSLAQARDIIVDKQIDLFIVDIGLPDGDGIDFLCEAAILHPQATAIIVTATPTEEHRARAEQLGIVQLLSKPIQRQKLVASVKKLIFPRIYEKGGPLVQDVPFPQLSDASCSESFREA